MAHEHQGDHSKHLCSRAAFGIDEIFRDQVKNAKFICTRCGRAATAEEYLCYPKEL